MSAAEASLLNWWSWVYAIGAWGVVLGVAMEVAEIIARRSAKRKQKHFVGPIQFPHIEPQTPDWAHNVGDIGFIILVLALVIEQLSHQRIEGIMGKEHDRITGELSIAITNVSGLIDSVSGLTKLYDSASNALAQSEARLANIDPREQLAIQTLFTARIRLLGRATSMHLAFRARQILRLDPYIEMDAGKLLYTGPSEWGEAEAGPATLSPYIRRGETVGQLIDKLDCIQISGVSPGELISGEVIVRANGTTIRVYRIPQQISDGRLFSCDRGGTNVPTAKIER